MFYFIALLLGVSGVGSAAQPDTAVSGLPLIVRGRVITEMRESAPDLTLEKRVQAARSRIELLLNEGLQFQKTEELTAVRTPEGFQILAGGYHMFYIKAGDLNPLANQSLENARDGAISQLARVIAEEKQNQNPKFLALSVLKSILVFFLVFIFGRFSKRLWKKIAFVTQAAFSRHQKTNWILKRIESWIKRLTQFAHRASLIAVSYLSILFVLNLFPRTRALGEKLGDGLLNIVIEVSKQFIDATPGLIAVSVIVFITMLINKIAHEFFSAVEAGSLEFSWLHPETIPATKRLFLIVLTLIAISMSYPYLPGSHSDAFKGMSMILGVMLSLGSGGVVGQVMSGLNLMYSRTIRVGDYVQVNGVEGTVMELGFMKLKLQTLLNESVTIPNASVVASPVTNYSRAQEAGSLYIESKVSIGYDVAWRLVHQLLEAAASATPGIKKDSKPVIIQYELGDFAIEYRILIALDVHPNKKKYVLNELHQNIQDQFNAHSVQIMVPHYEGDPAEPKVARKENQPHLTEN